jgi:hypothetical protein
MGFIGPIQPLLNLNEIGYFNKCNNINRLDLCKSYNKTFLSIEVIPIYKKIVELLKTSLELTLDCNNKIKSDNSISRIKTSKLDYYHVLFYIVLIIILYNLIRCLRNKVNKLK